jgi:16S rRNA (guanine527-N7)-methyltransferase
MTPKEFQPSLDIVPRGTISKLETYAALLADWQTRMNLVGPATLSDVWGRHFADSAQLAKLVPQGKNWLDIGAGAGFPGLVLAAIGWGRFTLVDSVAKKCRFLETVRGELDLAGSVSIICGRVEALPTLGVEVATARAAAPLATLFDWSIRHVRPGGLYVFPKGRRWAEEVADAQLRFSFDLEAHPSMTDPEARILVARDVKRR